MKLILADPQKKYLILDASAFIGLDFPKIQSMSGVTFLSPLSVKEELRDFRSRMNLDVMIHADKIRLQSPDLKNVKIIKNKLQTIDPNHKLSHTDIEVLTLAWEKKGTLISNDLAVQNAAVHFKIPIQVFSGKKIDRVRRGYLKCKGCNSVFHSSVQTCPNCGSDLKLQYSSKKYEDYGRKG